MTLMDWTKRTEGDRPLIIAHRGASAVAPGNTLIAFRQAVALGADAVELDVHLASDGVPMVIHDSTVDDTTNGSGYVADMTSVQLKMLDAGTPFDRAFAGERIPTLAEVIEAVGRDVLLNVELKSKSVRDNGLERAVVSVVEAYGVDNRVLFSSFNPLALRRVKMLAPHIPGALLRAPDLPVYLRYGWLAFLAPHEVRHPQHSLVDARYMAWARRRAYRVNAWTVDEQAEMRRLINLGVDGIITNRPDLLRKELDSLEGGSHV